VDALSITPPGGATDFTGDQLTGVQAHPQLELHTVAVVDFNGESLGLFLDAQGRQAGANSTVLQRHRRAEDSHDAVAGETADCAAKVLHHHCSPINCSAMISRSRSAPTAAAMSIE
jgi:hypothetical protein